MLSDGQGMTEAQLWLPVQGRAHKHSLIGRVSWGSYPVRGAMDFWKEEVIVFSHVSTCELLMTQ